MLPIPISDITGSKFTFKFTTFITSMILIIKNLEPSTINHKPLVHHPTMPIPISDITDADTDDFCRRYK